MCVNSVYIPGRRFSCIQNTKALDEAMSTHVLAKTTVVFASYAVLYEENESIVFGQFPQLNSYVYLCV